MLLFFPSDLSVFVRKIKFHTEAAEKVVVLPPPLSAPEQAQQPPSSLMDVIITWTHSHCRVSLCFYFYFFIGKHWIHTSWWKMSKVPVRSPEVHQHTHKDTVQIYIRFLPLRNHGNIQWVYLLLLLLLYIKPNFNVT